MDPNAYIILYNSILDHGRQNVSYISQLAGHIVYTAVEFLLVMRVYAFYGRNRNLLTILLLLFFGERGVATAVYIVRLPGVDMAVSEIPPPIHSGLCATMNSNAVFYLYWIPGAVVESVLFLLLIGMFVRVKRCTGMSSPRLLVVFVRDGAWAFTVIFAAMLWCSFTFRFDFARGDIATTWMFSAAGLCGSRLILNLCTVAREHVWITSNIHQLHTMPWITTD
ncbi:hypothetical protein K439DRAFT_1615382 [Ramaria rubella]|nr:hypothetical protein K439DRAFT_1615382 [Ramaria rubella]